MKTKTILVSVVGLMLINFFIACGSSNNNEKENAVGEKVDIDGSGVEMTFNRFDEDGKVVVNITNKMDKNIDEFRAEIFWLDADGNQITFATGAPRTTPIQQIQKNVGPSGRIVEYTLATGLDRAPEGTDKAIIELKSVKLSDKTEWSAEK